MDVSILPLHKIFGLDVQFRVPLYQRPYVWDRERQWEPLWEDVTALAQSELDNGVHPAPHFLGAVVVRQQSNPVGTLEIRDVIDGQQRLTTLQLLADAVEEAIREVEGANIESKKLRKIVLNDDDIFAGDDQFKVWPTNADQLVFRLAMTDYDTVPEDLKDNSIAQAHAFFKSSACNWAQDEDSQQSIAERFAALVNAIRSGLHLVVIDLSEKDNAQAIFETLNARGTPLLASDLVKNHLLSQAQSVGLDVEALHFNHWKNFEDDWWRQEVTLGRISWPRLDAFLFYWLGMNLTREVSAQRVFDEYRRLLTEHDLGVQEVASSISDFAGVFKSLEESLHEDRTINDFFYRWQVSQLRVLTPVLLWLFSDKSGINRSQLEDSVRLLESWFMRRMICRRSTQGYQNFLHPLLREVKKHKGEDVPAIIGEILSDAKAVNTAWPEDTDLQSAILERPLYFQLSRARLRLVLEAVEDRLCDTNSKAESRCPRDLTIEHLLPVSWAQEDWPLEGNRFSRDERNVLLHTLGNLTLVNDKLNPALSNSAWSKKSLELAKHSNLHLNKMLTHEAVVPAGVSWSNEWNENAIQERGEWLARQVCDIWARPE